MCESVGHGGHCAAAGIAEQHCPRTFLMVGRYFRRRHIARASISFAGTEIDKAGFAPGGFAQTLDVAQFRALCVAGPSDIGFNHNPLLR